MTANRDWRASASGGRVWRIVALTAWLASGIPAIAQTAGAGDPVAGEKVFAICSVCHQIGPGAMNAIGPVLNGVVGRHSGTYLGFMYSDANKNSGVTWDEKTLATYLPDPQKLIPGTTMPFALPAAKDVTDVIAYLKQFDARGNRTTQ